VDISDEQRETHETVIFPWRIVEEYPSDAGKGAEETREFGTIWALGNPLVNLVSSG